MKNLIEHVVTFALALALVTGGFVGSVMFVTYLDNDNYQAKATTIPDREMLEERRENSPYPGVYLEGDFSGGTWCRAEGNFYSLMHVPGLQTWIWTGLGSNVLFKPLGPGAWQADHFECSDNLFQVAVWRFEQFWLHKDLGNPGPYSNL